MYINPIAANNLREVKSRKKTANSSNFADMVDGASDAEGAGGTSGAAPVAATSAIFSLQEIDNEQAQNQQIVNQSKDILDELDKLKLDLLSGQISPQRLDRIVQLVDLHKQTNDPALKDLVAQIELRAQVELAKLGRL